MLLSDSPIDVNPSTYPAGSPKAQLLLETVHPRRAREVGEFQLEIHVIAIQSLFRYSYLTHRRLKRLSHCPQNSTLQDSPPFRRDKQPHPIDLFKLTFLPLLIIGANGLLSR